jgi:hypothetical protein
VIGKFEEISVNSRLDTVVSCPDSWTLQVHSKTIENYTVPWLKLRAVTFKVPSSEQITIQVTLPRGRSLGKVINVRYRKKLKSSNPDSYNSGDSKDDFSIRSTD